MSRLPGVLAVGFAAFAVIAVFHLFGGFTLPASTLLGGCFTICGVWIHEIYKIATFKPYSLQFFINFEALCEDLGMMKHAEPTDSEEIPHELYNFTAISAAMFVYYREYVNQTANKLGLTGGDTRTADEYRSAIGFGGTVPGRLKFPTAWGKPQTNVFWLPRFIFGYGSTAFELKIQVVPEWWSEYKKDLNSKLRDLAVDHNGFIVLAQLPYGYIPDHVRRYGETVSLFYPFDKLHRQWKSKLDKHGWTVTEADEEISSRYLIVRYHGIWPAS
ncbi:MAG TPA: hypothetical protein VFC39_22310 [Acidobacteriaceae bacterium]|nr:hypothetical protein [Acidobacteriaceae bacterium]